MIFNIRVTKIGKLHLAVTQIGGITLRGKPADDATDAVRNLLWRLSRTEDDDATVALSLAVEGTNLQALTDGSNGE